jgi:hypothetical protein
VFKALAPLIGPLKSRVIVDVLAEIVDRRSGEASSPVVAEVIDVVLPAEPLVLRRTLIAAEARPLPARS